MTAMRAFRLTGAAFLSAALLLQLCLPALPAAAQEVEEPTESETVQTEAPMVQETAETPETTAAAEETTAATEPQTTPTEVPAESTAATDTAVEPTAAKIQEAALQPPEQTVLTIAQAKEMPKGSEDITVQGTVVFTGIGQVVLQDDSGGMRIFFDDDPGAALGDELLVTGIRLGGFMATAWEKTGTAALPSVEATLADAPEDIRVQIKNVTLGYGFISQGEDTLSLTASLPENTAAGDTVDVYGVIMDGCLYADKIVKEAVSNTWDTWYPVSVEKIGPGDTVAVTVVKDGLAWALGAEGSIPQVVPVRLGADTMESQGGNLGWNLTRAEQGLTLHSDAGWLCALDDNDGLRIGSASDLWEIQDGYLCHSATGRYLSLSDQGQWRTLMDHQGEGSGQTLAFWRETPVETDPEERPTLPGGRWKVYFGQLHAHTNLSDGFGNVDDAFRHASQVEGLDFFAVTDHSNSFDNADAGSIGLDGIGVSNEWAMGKAAAAAVTDETFVGLFGYEMTWQEDYSLGHISTFNTPGWQTREQKEFAKGTRQYLQAYYEALTTVPGSVSQFNHPGPFYGEFDNFAYYTQAIDNAIHLLEVGGEGGARFHSAYTKALDQGWHVAPSNNQNNHSGSWGDASDARTVILAETLTEESIYGAIRNYRVYATEDKDLTIFYQLNGKVMGSILSSVPNPEITVYLTDPTDAAIGTVEVIVDGGVVAASRTVETSEETLTIAVPGGHSYYYLRITQPDGDIAITAPVWMENYEDIGIGSFTADTEQPVQGQEVNLKLELYNQETMDFSIDSLRFTLKMLGTQEKTEDIVIREVSSPGLVPGAESFLYEVPFTWPNAGPVEICATVTGSVAGETRTYEAALPLRYAPDLANLPVSDIEEARKEQNGIVCRVKGYVTAGNTNPYTTFPDTIYLQNDTGGIAVTAFPEGTVQVGTPLEVVGVLGTDGGNPVLQMISYTVLQKNLYRYVPRTMACELAMNYAIHGGELLQVEGKVVALTPTADGKGISRFIVEDIQGGRATILIEDYIRSGAYGTNELASQVKLGRTVRAMGLGHLDENGAPVLRVRNCEEVVYVPPLPDPSNPKTGDSGLLSTLFPLRRIKFIHSLQFTR